MKKQIGIAAAALTAAAAPVVHRLTSRAGATTNRDDPRRWHVVTVQCTPEEYAARALKPLEELDGVEVAVRPAPGDRGTEIAARFTADSAGHDEVRALRTALRDTRALMEVGWVTHPDRPGTTQATPLNAGLRAVTAHGKGEGRL